MLGDRWRSNSGHQLQDITNGESPPTGEEEPADDPSNHWKDHGLCEDPDWVHGQEAQVGNGDGWKTRRHLETRQTPLRSWAQK